MKYISVKNIRDVIRFAESQLETEADRYHEKAVEAYFRGNYATFEEENENRKDALASIRFLYRFSQMLPTFEEEINEDLQKEV